MTGRLGLAGLGLGSMLVLVGALAIAEPTAGAGGFSELFRAGIEGTGDLEVVMGLVERPAHSVSPKHLHPRGEFGFVLEGSVRVESQGRSPEIHEAGASFFQPPGEWHVIRAGASGARAVVFRVVDTGQPMVVGVE